MALGPKSQRDQVMVAIALVALLLILPYWMYVYSPKSEELVTLAARVDRLDRANERAQAEMKRGDLDRLREEALAFQRNLEVMRQLVPTSNEVPSLLEQVSTAARRVGLDLASVEPVPVIEGEQFDTYRYKVTVMGGYHELAAFLTNVGSLTRIVAPVNLGLVAAPASAAPAGAGASRGAPEKTKLECRIEIQTYVARTSAPRAKGAGEKTS